MSQVAMCLDKCLLVSLLSSTVLFIVATNAEAIQCDENFQIVNGQPVSTPFCRDNYLAKVAREYGFKVSDSTVRNSPARKEEICRMIGSDIRVQTACSDVLPDGHDRR